MSVAMASNLCNAKGTELTTYSSTHEFYCWFHCILWCECNMAMTWSFEMSQNQIFFLNCRQMIPSSVGSFYRYTSRFLSWALILSAKCAKLF